jgi:hypothetical protein
MSAVAVFAATPSAAHADDNHDIAINGVYRVTSEGQYAKTNDAFHDEVTVTSTWTVESTCTTYEDCTGEVSSDQGWRADIRYLSGLWRVVHTVEDWERCPDGTTALGRQSYQFSRHQHDPSTFSGWDDTLGPSGACGVNKWLDITMPLTLVESR